MTSLERPGTKDAARVAASALHRRIRSSFKQDERTVEFGTIIKTAPRITVKLHEKSASVPGTADLILVEEVNLQLSDTMRWWEVNFAFAVNDVVLLIVGPTGDFILFDLLTTRHVATGIRPSRPPTAPGLPMRAAEKTKDPVWRGEDPHEDVYSYPLTNHMVKKLEVFDKDGRRLGWVAVWDTLPVKSP